MPSEGDPAPAPSPAEAGAPAVSPALAAAIARRRYLRLEVAAVLLLAVIPDTAYAIGSLLWPRGVDYTFGSLWTHIMARSVQVSAVLLFIIWRSGERWSEFGLSRPRWRDLFLGVGLWVLCYLTYLALGMLLWSTIVNAGLSGTGSLSEITNARHTGSAGGIALAVIMGAANGFTEELAVRAYLLTRLRHLGFKPASGVLFTAGCFAAYHVYQGFWGASTAFVEGLILGAAYLLLRRVWPLAVAHALTDIVAYL